LDSGTLTAIQPSSFFHHPRQRRIARLVVTIERRA
jgi:hypothetical protein